MSSVGISEYFSGKSVLITGGTGFLGKVLIETLLRTCCDIKTIYVLIRPTKRQSVDQRLTVITESELFDWLRKQRRQCLSKVKGVRGDVTKSELDLSINDHMELTNNVSVVFHCAATVRFRESLPSAVRINVEGTRNILLLAKAMCKLEALVHVSTAYSNCNQKEILEKVYRTPKKSADVLDIVRLLDEDIVDSITPRLLEDWPNTYTFSKALAENLLQEEKGEVPVAILRPSIVTAISRGETPGWIDNINGLTGGIVAFSHGLLHNLCVNGNDILDLIPVDYVANAAMAVAWHTALNRKKELEVYNITSGCYNGLRWGQFGQSIKHSIQNYPPTKIIWYTTGRIRSNMLSNKVYSLIQQTIPAIFFDIVSYLTGNKPRFVKIVKGIDRAIEAGQFGMSKTFKFNCTKINNLYNCLTPKDQDTFYFNTSDIQWDDYIKIYYLGVRKYVMKEEMSTVAKAKSNLNRKYWIHQVTKAMILCILLQTVVKTGPTIKILWQYMTG